MNATEERQLTEVEAAVYEVYLALCQWPEDWIRIARIHEHLRRYHPADIAAAVISFFEHGDAQLAPESNTKVLTDEDHATAIRVGSEVCHLICFEED